MLNGDRVRKGLNLSCKTKRDPEECGVALRKDHARSENHNAMMIEWIRTAPFGGAPPTGAI
jgi:hypothetical protein